MGKEVQKNKRKYTRNIAVGRRITKHGSEPLTLLTMFEKFMVYKETEGLTHITLNDYHKHIKYLLEYTGGDLPSSELDLELFRGFIGFMIHDKGLSPVTANVRIRTMRAFIRHCFMEGWIEDPIHERFRPVKTEEDTLESFTPEEVRKLIKCIDDSTYRGFRDLIIVYILLDTMVRCSELINMKRANVDLTEGTIQLDAHRTKTKRTRIVPLSSKTISLLKDYMEETNEFNSEYLILTYEGHPLSDNTVRTNIRDWGKLAGLTTKRVSPHTFRHTGALYYILNGGDPFSLQKILGHSDMSMVRKYIQMTNADVKRQHNQYSPIKTILN